MVIIKKIIWSGGACPYQIEAITDDDKYFYLRYRGGVLRFGVWDSAEKCDHTNYAFVKTIGGRYDGSADQETFIRELDGSVKFPDDFSFEVPTYDPTEIGWVPPISDEVEKTIRELFDSGSSSSPRNPFIPN